LRQNAQPISFKTLIASGLRATLASLLWFLSRSQKNARGSQKATRSYARYQRGISR
jgi:hypothetical protein